jgi:hypothetical protein
MTRLSLSQNPATMTPDVELLRNVRLIRKLVDFDLVQRPNLRTSGPTDDANSRALQRSADDWLALSCFSERCYAAAATCCYINFHAPKWSSTAAPSLPIYLHLPRQLLLFLWKSHFELSDKINNKTAINVPGNALLPILLGIFCNDVWKIKIYKTVLNELYFWTLSMVWCLKKLRNKIYIPKNHNTHVQNSHKCQLPTTEPLTWVHTQHKPLKQVRHRWQQMIQPLHISQLLKPGKHKYRIQTKAHARPHTPKH